MDDASKQAEEQDRHQCELNVSFKVPQAQSQASSASAYLPTYTRPSVSLRRPRQRVLTIVGMGMSVMRHLSSASVGGENPAILSGMCIGDKELVHSHGELGRGLPGFFCSPSTVKFVHSLFALSQGQSEKGHAHS